MSEPDRPPSRPLVPLPKPTPVCQGRVGTKRCRNLAVTIRVDHPRFVCAVCLTALENLPPPNV